MNIKIPDISDSNVGKLIAKIASSGGGCSSATVPVIVPVKTEDYAEVNDCFISVQKKIQREGGNRILGWTLRHENFLMSAEFHAVWESPDGELLDVTPKGFLMPGGNVIVPTAEIMFVRAPDAKYEGKQVCNININITDNPLVDGIIDCQRVEFDIYNRGDRALQYGEIMLSDKEAVEMMQLSEIQKIIFGMLHRGLKSKDFCLCGSGQKYKNCHGKILKQMVDGISGNNDY